MVIVSYLKLTDDLPLKWDPIATMRYLRACRVVVGKDECKFSTTLPAKLNIFRISPASVVIGLDVILYKCDVF